MYYVVTKYDLEHLREGLISNQVKIIWRDILKKLPQNLRTNLKDAKFKLVELEGLRTRYDKTFVLSVPDAPKEFNHLVSQFENHILCFED